MKTSFKTLFALAAFGASALLSHAQPAPKILVVDLAKLYESHYKTEEQNVKLRGDEQKAQEELDRLNKEGQTLVEQFKEMQAQGENPALSPEAKGKAQTDAQAKIEEIKVKQNEVQNFRVNTQRSLQQRIQSFQGVMLEEISRIATEIAKKKGGTLLLGKQATIYSDPGYDITDEVAAEINKTRPVSTAVPAAPAPAAPAPKQTAPAPAGDATPTVTFPGAKK